MGDIQWNLLNLNAPAELPANMMDSFQQGVMTQQKMRMNALATQKAQQEMQGQIAMQNALAQSDGSFNSASKAVMPYNPELAIKLQRGQLDMQKGAIDQELKMQTLRKQSAELVANAPDGMVLQTALELADRNAELMGATPEQHAMVRQRLQQIHNTKGEGGLREEMLFQALGAKERLSKISWKDTGDKFVPVEENPYAPGYNPTPIEKNLTPQQAEMLDISRGNLEVAQGNLAARLAEKSQIDSQPTLTPEALDAAAYRYLTDGTIPSLGLGKQAAALRSSIINRAGEIASQKQIAPEDQRANQLMTGATKSAVTQLSKQEAMVGAFERNFLKNVELTEKSSKEVDRTGIPILNKWINAGKRAITGDTELSKFDVAIKSVVNEYTKIISGSMGNTVMAQAEIEKVNNLLSAAQTPEQVKEVLNFMKLETANRMKGFAEEKQKMKGELKLPENSSTSDIRQPTPLTTGSEQNSAIQQEIKITSDADYNMLPSGTIFIAPDGSRRRKP